LHGQLYSKIEEVEASENFTRGTFKIEVESLLRELMATIPEIKFIDDYRWIVAAIRQWEIYLRNSFGVVSCQQRPSALRALQLKPEPLPVHHSRKRKFARILADLGVRAGYWTEVGGELRTVVAAAVVTERQELLMQKLPRGPFEDYWGPPAAYVDFSINEDPAIVAMEKAKEAIGISSSLALHSEDRHDVLEHYSQESFCGLPTFIYAFKLRVPGLKGYSSRVRQNICWCKPEDLVTLKGKIHPMMPMLIRSFYEYLGSEDLMREIAADLEQKIAIYVRKSSKLWKRNEEAAKFLLQTDPSLELDMDSIVGPLTKADDEFSKAIRLVHECFKPEIDLIGARGVGG
jgi:hypothetical protein